MTKIIKEIKVKIDIKKTRLKKFNKKIEAEVELTRNANLVAHIRSIQV